MATTGIPSDLYHSALRHEIIGVAARPGFSVWPWPRPWRQLRDPTHPITALLIATDSDIRPSVLIQAAARDIAPTARIGPLAAAKDRPGDSPSVASMLVQAAKALHAGDTGVRFPRLRLVNFLADLVLEPKPGSESVDELIGKLRRYRSRRGTAQAQRGGLAAAASTPNSLWQAIFAILGYLAPSVYFRLWLWGSPGVGREVRWLRRQQRSLDPRHTFKTFTLRLTVQQPTSGGADIGRLAARAFLADLRSAYRPRLWRPRSWQRVYRPILIIDLPDDELPMLINQARIDEGEQDPLLVILAEGNRPHHHRFPCMPVTVPDKPEPGPAPSPPKAHRPRLAATVCGAAAITIPALISVAALVTVQTAGQTPAHPVIHPTPVPPPSSASCPTSGRANGETAVFPWTASEGDVECVGFSSAFIFKNTTPNDGLTNPQALQDKRLEYDQEQIFHQNALADQAQQERTVFELVYFAGLTSGPADDYDSGQAEELEGLLAAQEYALAETSGPLLKVIVANGGSKMEDAVPVASKLISLFHGDSSLLGVIGLDRSVNTVKQAIGLFNANGIPMVATTLSADGIGGHDHYYFQLPPTNSAEAALMLHYIHDVVPIYFGQSRQKYNSAGQLRPTRILIYRPSIDGTDLYTSTLVSDLTRVWKEPQFSRLPKPAVTTAAGSDLCGASTVVIYAGRHDIPPHDKYDNFTLFLQRIADYCPAAVDRPFIIADDGVTRFIADPAKRDQRGLGEIQISYVTKGIAILATRTDCLNANTATLVSPQMQEFCQAYAGIVSGKGGLNSQGITIPWTGERVGEAYDAAELFVQAELSYTGFHKRPITRPNIPGEFQAGLYHGATGTADFTASSHTGDNASRGMPLAIVRIALSSETATPKCEYPGLDGHIFGPGPNPGACP